MRIGLIGGNGVLGRRLSEALSLKGNETCCFNGDIRRLESVLSWADGFDRIVNLAAIVPTDRVRSNLYDAISVNSAGAANAAIAAERYKCHLTFISTSHVYRPKEGNITEIAETIPSSHYGWTKLHGESWSSLLAHRHLIVRVFSYFDIGQGNSFLVPSLAGRIAGASASKSIDLAGSQSVRDIADARWIASICADLVESGETGTTNCGTGVGTTVFELAKLLSGAFDRPDLIWRTEKDNSWNSLVADVSLLRQKIGDLPRFFLADSVREFASLYRRSSGDQ